MKERYEYVEGNKDAKRIMKSEWLSVNERMLRKTVLLFYSTRYVIS